MSSVKNAKEDKYWILDLFRFVSAVAVLFWHYQHFYLSSAAGTYLWNSPTEQPFFNIFEYLYLKGDVAVQVFWLISGFVLTLTYCTKSHSFRVFWQNRFARLYPLHLCTLLLVALLQIGSNHLFGHYQIYEKNDVSHFLAHLFMVSNWHEVNDFSFNAPIWSVSIEVFVYLLFSLLIIKNRSKLRVLSFIALAVSILFFAFKVPGPFWQCSIYFFLGSNLYFLQKTGKKRKLLALSFLTLIVIQLLKLQSSIGEINNVLIANILTALSISSLISLSIGISVKLELDYRFRKFLSLLGNLTYSSYLIHVPFQIAILILLQLFGFDQKKLVSSTVFFLLYFLIIFLVSHLVFSKLEDPLRRKLRADLIQKDDSPKS
jgi:peptidoglycan/LPS O-acetylase OafA/YrhL